MAAYQYYKADVIKRILDENDREKVNNDDKRIDPELTKYNRVIGSPNCKATTEDMMRYIDERLGSLGKENSKSPNKLGEWVVSLPAELKDRTDEEKFAFFDRTYKFIQDRYGVENVLPGFVHVDEPGAAWHLQVPIIPVAKAGTVFKSTEYDKEATEKARADGWTGKQKTKKVWKTYEHDTLSVHSVMPKSELKAFHDELDAVMADEYGMKGLIKNGRTKGNYTKEELKQRTADQKEIEQGKQDVIAMNTQQQEIYRKRVDELEEWEEQNRRDAEQNRKDAKKNEKQSRKLNRNYLKSKADELDEREARLDAREAEIRERNDESMKYSENAKNAFKKANETLERAKSICSKAPSITDEITRGVLNTRCFNGKNGIFTPMDLIKQRQAEEKARIEEERRRAEKERTKYAVEDCIGMAEDVIARDQRENGLDFGKW